MNIENVRQIGRKLAKVGKVFFFLLACFIVLSIITLASEKYHYAIIFGSAIAAVAVFQLIEYIIYIVFTDIKNSIIKEDSTYKDGQWTDITTCLKTGDDEIDEYVKSYVEARRNITSTGVTALIILLLVFL